MHCNRPFMQQHSTQKSVFSTQEDEMGRSDCVVLSGEPFGHLRVVGQHMRHQQKKTEQVEANTLEAEWCSMKSRLHYK